MHWHWRILSLDLNTLDLLNADISDFCIQLTACECSSVYLYWLVIVWYLEVNNACYTIPSDNIELVGLFETNVNMPR